MKILCFCNLVPNKAGAFEAFLVAMGRQLREQGGCVVLALAGEPIEQVATQFRDAGIEWHVINGWDDGVAIHPWRMVRPGLALLGEVRPDVAAVHFGNEVPSLALITLSRMRGMRQIAWVWHQHQGMENPTGLRARYSRIRLLGSRCAKIVALYKGGRTSLERRHVSAEKIAVIPNGVAPVSRERSRGWLRHELGIPESANVVVNVSSLVPRKRVDWCVRAITGTDAHMVLVGEGPEQDVLQALVEKQGLSGRVYFLGQRSDVREVLAECDLQVLCSRMEASPLAVIEGMSVGLPLVVTDAGGSSELVSNGITGRVVPCDDRSLFVTAVHELLGDAGLRRQMGTAGQQRWQEHFTLDTMVAKHLELYDELIS